MPERAVFVGLQKIQRCNRTVNSDLERLQHPARRQHLAIRPSGHQAISYNDGVNFRLDRSVSTVTSFTEQALTNRALRYWLTRPVAERLAAVEFLRRQFIGSGTRLRRVLRVTARPPR